MRVCEEALSGGCRKSPILKHRHKTTDVLMHQKGRGNSFTTELARCVSTVTEASQLVAAGDISGNQNVSV